MNEAIRAMYGYTQYIARQCGRTTRPCSSSA
jgi:hypothetical protein